MKYNVLSGLTGTEFENLELGNEPVIRVSFLKDEKLSYGIGKFIEEVAQLGLTPSEDALDLLLLAGTIFAADTRISRKVNSEDGWTREINIYLAVKNKKFWDSNSENLVKILNFLSGDLWQFNFVERLSKNENLVPIAENSFPKNTNMVCLFSGGLDSFTGAIDLLEKNEKPLFVGHYWDNFIKSNQDECFDFIKKSYVQTFPEINYLQARIGFNRNLNSGEAENTQRSRSFLFFCLGNYIANGIFQKTNNITRLVVPENGFIALNAPLDPLRLGALSTRTVHPFYLYHFNQFLKDGNLGTEIVNPFNMITKGEMMVNCLNQNILAKYAVKTISCSAPTKDRYTGNPPQHCGHCVPCIIRRASFKKAKINDNTVYTLTDAHLKHSIRSDRATGENYKSFQFSAQKLLRNPYYAKIAIHKAASLNNILSENDLENYALMYQRGLLEVWDFVKDIKTIHGKKAS